MADINETLKLLALLEYNDDPSKFLHRNRYEYTMTCGGVYQYANPYAIDFVFVAKVYDACEHDIKRASIMLYHDKSLKLQIREWCKVEVWDKMKLDEVESQIVADEMFLFAFHTGVTTAAKVAQRVVGVEDDGIIGPLSLEAINAFDAETFDIVYDEREGQHYKDIIEKRPYLQDNYEGWLNRAYKI